MTSTPAFSYERYRTAEADEWLLRIGKPGGRPILFVPPLLEEMNRTRTLMAAAMRLLAEDGFDCWLPDLPGTGESERPLDSCSWDDWRNGVSAAAEEVRQRTGFVPAVASLRGGALLDDAPQSSCTWRLSPVNGASLVRDLERASLVGAEQQDGDRQSLAGYILSSSLIEEMRGAEPRAAPRLRVLRLESDRAEADGKIPGPALWRRSEPGHSPALAGAIAADLADWVRQCAAS